jgi:protein-disulfide isomerase
MRRLPPLAAAILAGLVLGPSACRPGGGALTPGDGRGSRAEDADSLPAFEDGAVDPDDPDYEPERFHVLLGDAPTRGPATAEVTIVMFSDFECQFCLRGYDTMIELERRYPGKVRIAYKAYPLGFHPHALLAAMAARTAQAQGKFWEFHNLLFSGRELSVNAIFAYAREVGLERKKLADELEHLEYGPEVRADMRQARRLGVRSTPTFFINGREVSGAKPIEEFDAIVRDELTRSEEWKAEGIEGHALYAHAIADGYRRVEYSERGRGLDPDSVNAVPIGDSPARGPATAEITIVTFGDFECPFCTKGFETLEELEALYPGKIRMVYKHNPLPFHSHAWLGARAALAAAEQGKFWAYHDALYGSRARFDESDLLSIAKRVGLDKKKFLADMNSTRLDAAIERDLGLASALGVTGTPAYFVNGRPVEGALPLLEFRLLVEEELDRVAAAKKRGVAAADLYDTLSRTPIE